MRSTKKTPSTKHVYIKHKKAGNDLADIQKRSCMACGSQVISEFGEHLHRCENCGLVVAKEIPTFDELTQLYEEEYFFGMEYSDYQADRKALEHNFRQRIKHLSPYLHEDAKVAEVGCAYGYFLNMIKDTVKWHKGYDVTKEGVDYAVKELGVNAHSKDFLEDNEIKPGSLDLVCMWDVVEHLGEPHRHLEKAAELLKPGGALSLTTGDVSSYVATKRGLDWRMIHPPTHIYYFNVPSIKHILARHGLKVSSVRYKSTYRNAGSVFNQLIANRKAKQQNPIILDLGYKVARKTRLDKVNFPLNLYDVMEVTAVKQPV
jgi:2-polyprenyl-3-methyl-5-hydroxy-6-metoxy-1,4-benzoquinol methylase